MDDKWLVGVDIGGTAIKIAFVTEGGDTLYHWEISTDTKDQGKYIPVDIARAIDNKLNELGKTKDILLGVGIGAPGPINPKDGSVAVAVNLGWRDFPLKEILARETGLTVEVGNDANVAAIGEMWKGAGQGAKDLICVTLGTGVGGGVIANGEIIQGVNGSAGEIGHITVVPKGGTLCNCGKRGCLETMASATGIVRLAVKALDSAEKASILGDPYNEGKLEVKDIFDAANSGDKLAVEVVNECAFYLGLSLANIANVLDPEKLVIGGGVSKAGSTLLEPVREQFRQFAFPRIAERTELTIAALGNKAGVIGAAWLVKGKIGRMVKQ